MINKSKEYNSNYAARIVKLGKPRKHDNADRLQCWDIDFQNIITNLDYKEGDVVVCFPLESAINKDLIAYINGFENKTQNINPEEKGYFNKHARVRAVKLRGERSQGFVLPINLVNEWLSTQTIIATPIHKDDINQEFDAYNNIVICKKYVPKVNRATGTGKGNRPAVKRISRLVENQFRLHNDTDNLRKNVHKISPVDIIGVHYKKHGTSWVVGNVLTKVKLNWFQKVLLKLGVNITTEKYDYIYSSRKVVKNEYETAQSQHYYKYDLWGDIKDQVAEKIPKGYTLYGEYIGYDKNGGYIQSPYDYGCDEKEGKIYVYRITITNSDGEVIELSDLQIAEFCKLRGLNYEDTFIYYGKAKDLYPELKLTEHWHQEFVKNLERDFNNKDCHMCKNTVPEEGIVIRKQSTFEYEAYKLKSARFFEFETEQLDKGVIDIETLETTEEEVDKE